MGLTFLKPNKVVTVVEADSIPKMVVPPVVTYDLTEAQALVQEFLILHEKLLEIGGKDFLKRMETLRKQLQSIAYDTVNDEEPAVFSCAKGKVVFSERGETVEVTHPRILIHSLEEAYGIEVAWSIVSILITPLRKILSEAEINKVVTKKPGIRTIKDVILKK